MAKPCPNCLRMLEGGVQALWELVEFTPEELPPLPPKINSWRDLHEFLVRTVGHLQDQARPH